MGWAFLYLFVVLKIPVALALWLVWYAVRAQPVQDEGADAHGDGGGGIHPRPRHPGPPRRGPHREPPPRPPARVRATAADLTRSHG